MTIIYVYLIRQQIVDSNWILLTGSKSRLYLSNNEDQITEKKCENVFDL